VVVASAFTLMLVGFTAAYSFAAFFGAFQDEFGASRGDVALVFSAAAFLRVLAGAPGGMLADRFGARRVALAGVALLVAALLLAAVSPSVGARYATYSIGIGLGVGLTYVPSVGAVQPWFGARRALASGIAVAGIGAGNIAGPLLAAWWIGLLGWRGAYVALAIFVLLLGGGAALLLRNKPTTVENPVSIADALRTTPFWLLYASLVLSCIGLFVPMVHLGAYAQDLGYSATQGVALVSLIGLGSLLGRFTVGPFADRMGREASLAAMYAGLGIMLIVWWAATAWWLLALFAVVFGICYGAYVALMPTIVMDLYGPRAVSGITGFLYTGAGLGTLVGPWLAGLAYDAFGAYDLPILGGSLCAFLAAATVVIMMRSEKDQVLHRG
jgi:MFS family permease